MSSRELGRSLVPAIIQAGHALGMTVTAEGVETPGQRAKIKPAPRGEADLLLSLTLSAFIGSWTL